MHKLSIVALVLACMTLSASAQSHSSAASVNVRFSEQISNGPAGSCGCFAMQGAAGDVAWRVYRLGRGNGGSLSGVADVGVEHTGSVSGAPYGLTLTTVSFGPRFTVPASRHAQIFAQSLFGVAYGSNSQFPEHNTFVTSANSFALNLGAGLERSLSEHIAVRILQMEYLRTALPNNSSNWQNNLRLSAGITFRFR